MLSYLWNRITRLQVHNRTNAVTASRRTQRDRLLRLESLEERALLSVTRLFVDADTVAAVGDQNGQAWSTAYANLQNALDYATANTANNIIEEIWIADGTYKPISGTVAGSQNFTFNLVIWSMASVFTADLPAAKHRLLIA